MGMNGTNSAHQKPHNSTGSELLPRPRSLLLGGFDWPGIRLSTISRTREVRHCLNFERAGALNPQEQGSASKVEARLSLCGQRQGNHPEPNTRRQDPPSKVIISSLLFDPSPPRSFRLRIFHDPRIDLETPFLSFHQPPYLSFSSVAPIAVLALALFVEPPVNFHPSPPSFPHLSTWDCTLAPHQPL
ncbi:hypothetical protein P175DRAFT_0531195 [Aspergillus ochraceoroseus IBT 24754]|uniref:Uncharacterized protein n=1 Tax=Aspergillus ochraceoroseus IBT 24754 TaxID=1392256 RepID=A0A2T5LZG2_9EURO|nr:uncharacterized protein P175DRAFT_0531195 [Aspergillus ochraceoroseus IBT 24754]PTU21677.1 hypothetical protein P175DRAFT_0531195 [Aspergillus ochraceoroseus IBT 24754]